MSNDSVGSVGYTIEVNNCRNPNCGMFREDTCEEVLSTNTDPPDPDTSYLLFSYQLYLLASFT